jgi:hypothetical protein
MFNPYAEPSPYDILGVSCEASAAEIRDRYNALQRENQESGAPVSERSKRKTELEDAYNKLRVSSQRVKVDFSILDPRIGLKQCESLAASVATPKTTVDGLVKPRTIQVMHTALLSEPATMTAEPPRVTGLYPQSIEAAETPCLPQSLAIQFDC